MHPSHGIALPVRITEVYDGDTITVERTWRARVRLLDCWAAEIRGGTPESKAKGLHAKKCLEEWALNQEATLFIPTEHADRVDDVLTMGRVLGHIYLKDMDLSLSQMMVGSGLATKEKS